MKLLHIVFCALIVMFLNHVNNAFAQGFEYTETYEPATTPTTTQVTVSSPTVDSISKPTEPLIKTRALALTAELTASSLGVGVEASIDLGYLGVAAGMNSTFIGGRTYIMARAQTPGIVAGYIGVGGASATQYHFNPNFLSDENPAYTEESSNVMGELGVKLQLGYLSARAYVGLDTQIETNCRNDDCEQLPMYGGLAFGIALH
jgi:hypothetical protein